MKAKGENIRNVPNLRFPEFEGGWSEKVLSELGSFIGGGTPSSGNKDFWNGEIPWISSSDINDENIYEIRTTRFITEDALKQSATKLCSAPLVSIVSRVGVGKVVHSTKDLCTSQDFVNIVAIKCNSLFLAHVLSVIMKSMAASTQGTSIKGVTSEEIKKIKLKIPIENEQQKITEFFSLIDARIQTQIKIIKHLETLIRALRENLFAQDLRLKDENQNDFPAWKIMKLEEIGELISGLTYSPNEINDDGVLVLRSSNVQRRVLCFDDNVFVRTNNFNPVMENDILICVRNGSKNLIGKNAIIKKAHIGHAFGAFMTVYRSTSNKFLFQWFDTKQYKLEVHKNLGATINSINGSDLKKFKVPYPSKSEQKKIANLLCTIDERILTEYRILKQYELQKMYLLSNLFI